MYIEFLSTIASSVAWAPREMGVICYYLMTEVSRIFPGSGFIAVAGYLFLRFFCPAIVAPKSFDLLPDDSPPFSEVVQRRCKAVSKVLQTLVSKLMAVNTPGTSPAREDGNDDLSEWIASNAGVVKKYYADMVSLGAPEGVVLPTIQVASEVVPEHHTEEIDQNMALPLDLDDIPPPPPDDSLIEIGEDIPLPPSSLEIFNPPAPSDEMESDTQKTEPISEQVESIQESNESIPLPQATTSEFAIQSDDSKEKDSTEKDSESSEDPIKTRSNRSRSILNQIPGINFFNPPPQII